MRDRRVLLSDAVVRGNRVEASLRAGARSATIWFSSDDLALTPTVDAFFCVALIAAMRQGAERLVVEAPVSARLLAAVPAVQRQLCEFSPAFAAVAVDAVAASVPSSSRSGSRPAAVCFSGGLDSLYTAVTHDAEIGALVHVRQYQFLANLRPRSAIVEANLRAAAARLERPLIAIDTNLREHGDLFGLWKWLQGAAMAAAGQLLRAHHGRLLIASSHSDPGTEGSPWGTHPELDPLWSTEAVEVVHDAAGVTRIEKLVALAHVAAAREHLLVCHASTDERLNCGRCEKCIRTRVAVRIAGLEGVFSTLPSSVSLLRAASAPRSIWSQSPRANLEAARANGQRALAIAIAASIALGKVRGALAHLRSR